MESKPPAPPIPPKEEIEDPSAWYNILWGLYRKHQYMKEHLAFGSIGLEIKYHRGKPTDIVWSDQVIDKDTVAEMGGMNSELAKDKKPIR